MSEKSLKLSVSTTVHTYPRVSEDIMQEESRYISYRILYVVGPVSSKSIFSDRGSL